MRDLRHVLLRRHCRGCGCHPEFFAGLSGLFAGIEWFFGILFGVIIVLAVVISLTVEMFYLGLILFVMWLLELLGILGLQ